MPPRTAFYAPAHRINNKANNAAVFNPPLAPDVAPSLDFGGSGIQDHRLAYNVYSGANAATALGILGWYGEPTRTINVAPATLGAANIAALANVVSGTPMTLAGASTGITVVPAGGFFLFPKAVTVPAGALCLDGSPAIFRFGSGFITGFYDPGSMLSRAVSVTGVAGGTGGDFLVSGYDAYGEAMSETITATAGATSVNGKKAFKFVSSIVPQFTDAHNYSFGTTDIFGFPLLAASFYDQTINWNNALIVASTGFVAAVTAAPTATTGDVRGTYAVQSASDGTKRLVVTQRPSLSTMQSLGATVGLFGQVQA